MRALFFLLLAVFVLPVSAQDTEVKSADNVYVADGLVYYSLTNNAIVPADEKTATNWDILINGVELHANRAGLVITEAFDAVAEAPLEGMKNGMMKTADGEVWYNYDMNTHEISPKGDMTFVLMLADDSYAKLTVDSYYHRITEEPRYMSFRYVIAGGGERSFMD
ncbi:MAG: hypothetical protein HKN29_02320 [Rhodothermales bacterium]|nr:hypothetical protein [Rhodothermales bacterium]